MPSPLPYRKHFIGDWIKSASVREMNMTARGVYMALLDVQWEEEFIEDSPSKLQKIIPCTRFEWSHFATFFDRCFPLCEDKKRRNPRCQYEREHALHLSLKNRENGRSGGRPKQDEEDDEKENRSQTERLAKQKRSLTERQPKSQSESESYIEETVVGNAGATACLPAAVFWWDAEDCEPLAAWTAKTIRAAKWYGDYEPTKPEIVDQLLERIAPIMPDEQSFRDVVEAWAEYVGTFKKRRYEMVGRTLREWCQKREAQWRQIKRERERDSRPSSSPAVQRGKPKRPGMLPAANQFAILMGEPVDGAA